MLERKDEGRNDGAPCCSLGSPRTTCHICALCLPAHPCPASRKSSQLNADTLSLIALNFGQLFVLSLLLGAAVGLFSAWFIKRTFVQ